MTILFYWKVGDLKVKYDIKKDHAEIKKQIKTWEKEMDRVAKVLLKVSKKGDWSNDLPSPMALADDLEDISHEMMAINM